MLVRIIDRGESFQVFEFDGVRRVVEVTTDDGRATSRSTRRSASWTRSPLFADHDAESGGSGPVSPLPEQ